MRPTMSLQSEEARLLSDSIHLREPERVSMQSPRARPAGSRIERAPNAPTHLAPERRGRSPHRAQIARPTKPPTASHPTPEARRHLKWRARSDSALLRRPSQRRSGATPAPLGRATSASLRRRSDAASPPLPRRSGVAQALLRCRCNAAPTPLRRHSDAAPNAAPNAAVVVSSGANPLRRPSKAKSFGPSPLPPPTTQMRPPR